MGEALNTQMGEVSLEDGRTPFGKQMLKHFRFDPNFINLNQGSFGAFPHVVRQKQREYQDACERRPDPFIRYDYPRLLDVSRAAIAKVLNAPLSTIVFVPNVTTGVNTIIRNIVWNTDGKDEILFFSTAYGACANTIDYISEVHHNLVQPRLIDLTYPVEDLDLLDSFKQAIKASRAVGKRPRLAMFDTVSSLPGVRMPFESLAAICKEEGIFSLIDGAHGVGHLPLDLSALDPDFFTSNAHKWFFVPRGCAVLYVPERNQPLIRSSLPTSHGFVSKSGRAFRNPLPPSSKSEYVNNFEFVGTIDNTNYLVIPEAIEFRKNVCGGEEAIMEYCSKLAKEGGEAVARILGTNIMDNSTGTLTRGCCIVNVLLPLEISPSKVPGQNCIDPGNGMLATQWMEQTLTIDFKTFLPIYFFQEKWWTRLSAQIYLELADFEWAGAALKAICERAGKGEFLNVSEKV
ncbi:PLP-dependent transferase [Hyaloscypha variabilis]